MKLRSLALLTVLSATGCGTVVKHTSTINLDPPVEESIAEPCQQVATPAFYGHYGTCWKKWPEDWSACRHGEIDVVDETPEAPSSAPTPAANVELKKIEKPANKKPAPKKPAKTGQLRRPNQSLWSSVPIFKIVPLNRSQSRKPTQVASQTPPVPVVERLPEVKDPYDGLPRPSQSAKPTAPKSDGLAKEQVAPPKLFVVAPREDFAPSPNAQLARDVSERLSRVIKARQMSKVTVHVNVVGDIAWVSGRVSKLSQRDELLRIAEQTKGIRKVYHRLKVGRVQTARAKRRRAR